MRHPGWKKVDALTAALSQLSCGDREVEIDPEIRAMKQKPARQWPVDTTGYGLTERRLNSQKW